MLMIEPKYADILENLMKCFGLLTTTISNIHDKKNFPCPSSEKLRLASNQHYHDILIKRLLCFSSVFKRNHSPPSSQMLVVEIGVIHQQQINVACLQPLKRHINIGYITKYIALIIGSTIEVS